MSDPNRFMNDWLNELSPAAKAFWTTFLIVLLVGCGIILFSFMDRDVDRATLEAQRIMREVEQEEARKQLPQQ